MSFSYQISKQVSRKLLSLVALRRIEHQIDMYTGPWQAGCKVKRGTSDIVWSQRLLVGIVLEKRWQFHKMGIDMSSAFDTIDRRTILRLLEDAGCSNDDIRIVRFLLSNTKLKVKINKAVSEALESNMGSFEGDSLSGKIFTLVLAGALNNLTAKLTTRPNPPISQNGMPTESEYVDDVDFIDRDMAVLKSVLPEIKSTLKDWSLFLNES